MEESNQPLEDRTRFIEMASSQINKGKREFTIRVVVPLITYTVGFLIGSGIGIYINNQINPKIDKPTASIQIQDEQDPHKYSISKPKSLDSHHFVLDR